MTGDDSSHAHCFKGCVCYVCKKLIDNMVFAKTSQGIYCMKCHNERVAKSRRHHEKKKEIQREREPELAKARQELDRLAGAGPLKQDDRVGFFSSRSRPFTPPSSSTTAPPSKQSDHVLASPPERTSSKRGLLCSLNDTNGNSVPFSVTIAPPESSQNGSVLHHPPYLPAEAFLLCAQAAQGFPAAAVNIEWSRESSTYENPHADPLRPPLRPSVTQDWIPPRTGSLNSGIEQGRMSPAQSNLCQQRSYDEPRLSPSDLNMDFLDRPPSRFSARSRPNSPVSPSHRMDVPHGVESGTDTDAELDARQDESEGILLALPPKEYTSKNAKQLTVETTNGLGPGDLSRVTSFSDEDDEVPSSRLTDSPPDFCIAGFSTDAGLTVHEARTTMCIQIVFPRATSRACWLFVVTKMHDRLGFPCWIAGATSSGVIVPVPRLPMSTTRTLSTSTGYTDARSPHSPLDFNIAVSSTDDGLAVDNVYTQDSASRSATSLLPSPSPSSEEERKKILGSVRPAHSSNSSISSQSPGMPTKRSIYIFAVVPGGAVSSTVFAGVGVLLAVRQL
ncbi:hypothetical protein OE88DRAFT_1733392 [Heliocybe sulcata]|uniref:Uncharacterized protein n=1 Tax=Heliocybe sulcata TaxID=5364 RepID=A0A5C3N8B0_9AGAM|nr:hypothetical protein OE88DRAFT_1733392 [Heliocybe sulcata]